MKIVFMGTPEFAIPCLERLINSNDEVIGVFTQPDKPKGRGYKLQQPPIKVLALKNKIEVFQPNSLKSSESFNIINELSPDLIIVVAYGKILPKEILKLPKYGCINVHASLLPKYRGAAPIQWSIINGEKTTGVTTMYMSEGLDTGDMLKKAKINILQNETAGQLHDKLSKMGADLLLETINDLKNNKLKPEKQNDNESSYAPMLTQENSIINWEDNAENVHNFIRGLNPWPVAKTTLNGKKIKIYSSSILECYDCLPGEIVSLSPLIVGCNNNTAIIVDELQLEGKKRMSSRDFLNGKKIELGSFFGK